MLISKSYLISIFIIPIFLFFLLKNLNVNNNNKINVGICYKNIIEQNFNDKLLEYTKDTINLIYFENEKDLIKNVENYNIDCGYFFVKDLKTEYKKSIIIYETETTTVSNILNPLIASIAIGEKSGELGYQVLKEYFNINENEIKKNILEKYYDYLKNSNVMNIEYKNINSKIIIESKNILDTIIYGIISIIGMFFSIQNSSKINLEKNSEVYNRIKLINYKKYNLINFISLYIINFLYISFSQIILLTVFKTTFNILNVIIGNLIFSLSISLINIFLINFFKDNKYFFSLNILNFILSFIFSEILFNIKEVLIRLNFLKYLFPSYYYMKIINNSNLVINILLMLFLNLFIFLLFLQKSKVKTK